MAHYAEQFAAAVNSLVSEGPVKERLVRAYVEFLEELQHEELPPAVRESIGELHTAMHRVAPMGKETPVKASVQKMSPSEAASYAASIVEIYVQLLTQGGRSEPLKVVETGEQVPPPRYLVSGS